MIQVNLIPDVKLEYLRVQRLRNIIIAVSVIVSITAVVLAVIAAIIYGTTVALMNSGKNDIKQRYAKLEQIEDSDKLVTIQNQLTKIDELHGKRSKYSRIFPLLEAVRPKDKSAISFTTIVHDPGERTISIEGTANDGFKSIEVLKKTLAEAKLTYSKLEDGKYVEAESIPLLESKDSISSKDTILSEDSRGEKVLRFAMSFVYTEGLFDNNFRKVVIDLPDQRVDVTDSKQRLPESLFVESTQTKEGEGN